MADNMIRKPHACDPMIESQFQNTRTLSRSHLNTQCGGFSSSWRMVASKPHRASPPRCALFSHSLEVLSC